jgi:transposase-like protein
MFLQRGIVFTHEAVREWEMKVAPLISDALRKRRRGVVCESWYVDETYIKVNGQWCYLYRAIDRDGKLVDVMLSETHDLEAAKAFFRSALGVTDVIPDRVTSDGHSSYPNAVKTELGEQVTHRTNQYLNNHLEQDHRGIKQRYRPMLGFKVFDSAARFCRAYDELRNFLRPVTQHNQKVSLARRRVMHSRRISVLMNLLEAVWRKSFKHQPTNSGVLI